MRPVVYLLARRVRPEPGEIRKREVERRRQRPR